MTIGHRAGITTEPEQRRDDSARQYRSMRNWQEAGPFLSIESAQRWEDEQVDCEKNPRDKDPGHPFVLWFGYRFDY